MDCNKTKGITFRQYRTQELSHVTIDVHTLSGNLRGDVLFQNIGTKMTLWGDFWMGFLSTVRGRIKGSFPKLVQEEGFGVGGGVERAREGDYPLGPPLLHACVLPSPTGRGPPN